MVRKGQLYLLQLSSGSTMLIKINKSIFNLCNREEEFFYSMAKCQAAKIPFTSNCCRPPSMTLSCLCHSVSHDWHKLVLDCLPQYMYKYVYINLHSLEVVEAGLILSSCLANRVKMILSERRCFNIHRVIKFRNLPQSSKKNKSTTSHHKYSKNENNVHKLVIQITVQKIAKPKWTFTSNFRYIQSFSCKVIHSRKRGLCKK